jgi:hypothetical protein
MIEGRQLFVLNLVIMILKEKFYNP